jgi:hypothetical protein
MTTNDIPRTPFEQAELNAKVLPARMALCAKVQEMVQILVEVQKLREIPHDNMMHDPSILRIAEEEEAKIMQQLTVLAELWQKTEGVTA